MLAAWVACPACINSQLILSPRIIRGLFLCSLYVTIQVYLHHFFTRKALMKLLQIYAVILLFSNTIQAACCLPSSRSMAKAIRNSDVATVKDLLENQDFNVLRMNTCEDGTFYDTFLCMGLKANSEEIKKAFVDHYARNFGQYHAQDTRWFGLKAVLWADNVDLLQVIVGNLGVNAQHPITQKTILLMATEAACCFYRTEGYKKTGMVTNCLRHLVENCHADISCRYHLPGQFHWFSKHETMNSAYADLRELDLNSAYDWYRAEANQQPVGVADYATYKNNTVVRDYLTFHGAPLYNVTAPRYAIDPLTVNR